MNSYILDPNYVPCHENMIEVFPDEGYARVYFQNKQYENTSYVIIDIDKIEEVKKYKWHIHKCKGGVQISNPRYTANLSNVILGLDANVKNIYLKFKNGNHFDFRRSNIEAAYFTQLIIGKCYKSEKYRSYGYEIHCLRPNGKEYEFNFIFSSPYIDEAIYASYIFRSRYYDNKGITNDDLLELKKFEKFIPEDRKKEIEEKIKVNFSKIHKL